MSDVVEAMARGMFEAHGEREWSWEEVIAAPAGSYAHGIAVGLRTEARAAIRAVTKAGGLVLRQVLECEEPVDAWQEGYNAALSDVRASAVEVGE